MDRAERPGASQNWRENGLAVLVAALVLPNCAASAQEVPLGSLDPKRLADEAQAEAEIELQVPRLTWGLAIEVENDWTFSSDDPDAELNDLYPTVEGELAFEVLEGTGVFAAFTFEPVQDPEGDRAFEDLGLYINELFLQGQFENVTLTAGKFGPAFALAWDVAPGLYGDAFAEDLELAEMIGAQVGVGFELGGGEHEFNAALFVADRTILSESAFENRGRLNLRDGGAANTNGPESFALSLQGKFDTLTYHLGGRYLSGGEGDPGDEAGLVAAMQYVVEGAGPGDLELLVEGAYLFEAGGGEDDVVYLTLGSAYGIDAIAVSAVYNLRDTEAGTTDHSLSLGLDYEIFDGLSAGLGYQFAREDGIDGHTLGVVIAYEIGGGISFAGLVD